MLFIECKGFHTKPNQTKPQKYFSSWQWGVVGVDSNIPKRCFNPRTTEIKYPVFLLLSSRVKTSLKH